MDTLQKAYEKTIEDAVSTVIWGVQVDGLSLADSLARYVSKSAFGPASIERLQIDAKRALETNQYDFSMYA